MQVPPLETHRRDGLFLSIQQELSLPSLSRTLHETPRPFLQLFQKGETNKIKSDKDSFPSTSVSLSFNSADRKRGLRWSEEDSEWEQGWGSRKLGDREKKEKVVSGTLKEDTATAAAKGRRAALHLDKKQRSIKASTLFTSRLCAARLHMHGSTCTA